MDHNKLWKILQEIGIPDHLTRLLGNLCAGQKATVRNGHEFETAPGDGEGQGNLDVLQSMGSQSQMQQNNIG